MKKIPKERENGFNEKGEILYPELYAVLYFVCALAIVGVGAIIAGIVYLIGWH